MKETSLSILIIVLTGYGVGSMIIKVLEPTQIISTTKKPEIAFKVIKTDTVWFYKFEK